LWTGEFEGRNNRRTRNGEPKIRWWRLKEEKLRKLFREGVIERIKLQEEDVQERWDVNSTIMLTSAEKTLGRTSGKSHPTGK